MEDKYRIPVQRLRFADDIAVIVVNEENLINMLRKNERTRKKHHMKIKQRKNKILVSGTILKKNPGGGAA